MAGQRISDLTAITAASTADDDYFLIFDSSTDTTKKILKSELSAMAQTDLTAASVLAKLLTVDGPGSLIDADTLDGVQLAALAQLSGAAFTGAISSTSSVTGATGEFTTGLTAGAIIAPVDTYSLGTTALPLAAANTQIFISDTVTIPSAVFTKSGTSVLLHCDGTIRTINRGSGLTMYYGGTNVATLYLDPYRSLLFVFESSTVCRVFGTASTTPPP